MRPQPRGGGGGCGRDGIVGVREGGGGGRAGSGWAGRDGGGGRVPTGGAAWLRGMCGWCAASVTMATAPLQRGGAGVAGRLEGEVATRAEEGAGRPSVSAAVAVAAVAWLAAVADGVSGGGRICIA